MPVNLTPRLLSEKESAQYLSISSSHFRKLGLNAKWIGRRKMFDRHDLDAYVDELAYAEGSATNQNKDANSCDKVFG